jgi:dCMP deaminase
LTLLERLTRRPGSGTLWPESGILSSTQASYRKPSWDEYFMAMAVLAASRATCERGRVGCALVRENRLLATGYNGPVGGNPDCRGQDRCRRTADGGCAETAHAEQNAVAYAARYGVDLTGCTCYLSGYSPCLMCAKLLIQCGCRKVIFRKPYRDVMPLEFLEQVGVEMFVYAGQTPSLTWLAPEPPQPLDQAPEAARGQLPIVNALPSDWAFERSDAAIWRVVRVPGPDQA